jgi:hypothetical protein
VVLVDGDPTSRPSSDGEPRAPRGRQPVIGVLVAVAVVAVLLAVVDAASSGGEADEAAATTKTEPASTTRRRRSPTTTTMPSLAPLALGEETALRLVVMTDGRPVIVDLDAGRVEALGRLGPEVWSIVAVPAGVVFIQGDSLAKFVTEGVGSSEPINLGRASRVILSVEPDRVWLLNERDATGTRAVEMSLPSRAVMAEVTIRPPAWVVDAVAGGLLVAAPDGAYVVHSDGSARRVSRGAPIAGRADEVLEHRCDERLQCRLEVHNLATGLTQRLPVPDAVAATVGEAVFSADGRRLALVSYPTGDMFVFDLTGAEVAAAGPFPLSVGVLRWSPDGEWLFAVSSEASEELLVLRARDGVTHRLQLGSAAPQVHDIAVLGPAV